MVEQDRSKRRQEQPTVEEAVANLNRPMPFNDDAEKGVLSCMLQDSARILACQLEITPEAFYHEANRTVYEEIIVMESQGMPLATVAILLTNRLRDRGLLERVGGPAAISEIATFTPTPAHFRYFLDEVVEKWKQRRAIHGHALAILALYDHCKEAHEPNAPRKPIQSTINEASRIVETFVESATAKVGTSANLSTCLLEHTDFVQELTERRDQGKALLLPTGFPTLDRVSGGIGRDEYILLTGPTKSGKTVGAMCMAANIADKGNRTKYYSFEVARRTLAGRLIAGNSSGKLDGRIDRTGLIERVEWEAYAEAVRRLQRTIGQTLIIDNSAGKFVEDLVMDMRQEADEGTQLVVVDLIGKVRTRARFNTREQELAHISLSLYEATKRFGIAAIVLAQENEDGQARDSRSMMMDCEAWLKVCHVKKQKDAKGDRRHPRQVQFGQTGGGDDEAEYLPNRRNLIVELARGFASGDVIPLFFDGPHFLMRELTRDHNEP